MQGNRATVAIAVLVMGILCAAPAWPQNAANLDVLMKEIQSLKDGQAAIQKDLESIKGLLQQRPPAQAQAPRVNVEPVELAMSLGGAPSKGAADAKVAVIEFTDYQCPFCARHAAATLPSIENDYVKTGKIKYVVRDFPIASIHPQAAKAHEAAHCAGEQGKYWDMQRQLFANQRKLGAFDLMGHAKSLGLDRQEFESCMDGNKHAATVASALADGGTGGVTGTPTFFLGLIDAKTGAVKITKRIQGAQPYSVFKEAIESLLNPPT